MGASAVTIICIAISYGGRSDGRALKERERESTRQQQHSLKWHCDSDTSAHVYFTTVAPVPHTTRETFYNNLRGNFRDKNAKIANIIDQKNLKYKHFPTMW